MPARHPDPDLHGPGFWAAVFSAALTLYPRAYRERMGPDMVRTFRRQLSDVRREGAPGSALFLLREFAGLPFHAIRERFRDGDRGRSPDRGRSGFERITRGLLELKQASRRLRRSPGFTTASVLTLALGVGATTAVYSLVQSTVIDPLPYPDSDELVWMDHAAPGLGSERGLSMTDGLFAHYSQGSTQLRDMAVWLYADFTLAADEPERLSAAAVTPSFFAAMRTPPVAGRAFGDEEARVGQGGVVISHDLWYERFGGSPDAIGRVIRLDGQPVQIRGVMPAGFEYPRKELDLWVPLWVAPDVADFGGFSRGGVARLAPGATPESAAAELAVLLTGLPARFGPGVVEMLEDSQLTPILPSLKEEVVRESEKTLWILLGSVVFVLLLTCANVANLLLVRAESRHRETAMRRALGAGRVELVRYFMAEGLLLSLLGGAVGVALALGAVRMLVAFGPADLPRLAEIGLSPAVVGVALSISFVTSVLFGLLPALRRTPSLAHTIKSGDARASAGPNGARSRSVLVATQVALAMVLLVATGLMSRSFVNLVTLDPGFDASDVLTFSVGLPSSDYSDRAGAVAFHREAADRIAALPGVDGVAVSNCLPMCGSWAGIQLDVEGRAPDPSSVPGVVAMRRVSDSFFETMRIRLLRGRLPTRADHDNARPLAVISERLGETYWPNEDPIGQRFRPGSNAPWFEVVGIVANTPVRELADDPPMAYLPLLPGSPIYESSSYELSYMVRTSVPPTGLLMPARAVIRDLDGRVPLANASTLERLVANANVSTGFTMVVLAVAAGIALLLGIVGIYGVISYTVGQRAKEIGIRMALGARSGQVGRAVVVQGGKVAAVGLVAGLVGALALTRVMESLLFGVSPTDPLTFAVTAAILLLVALGATYLPARRAARVDPLITLRSD
ncbi:MAG: ABC transporter permease [Gemmatimonadota bacterium]|nr:ABC transporter permease [Gemmatimonadota bacterium]